MNKLPAYELVQLQNLVDSLFKVGQRPVPFYMDTLMIPYSKDKPIKENYTDNQKFEAEMRLWEKYKERKSKALGDMK